MNFWKRAAKRLTRPVRSQRGFSLLELLIVLVILGILVGLAIPRYMASTVKAKQAEAQQLLQQIYLLQRTYYQRNDGYWIPDPGALASADNPYAFDTLGFEVMSSARYRYQITGTIDAFRATATADRLDDDPSIDQWEIDQTGNLRVIVDDAISR